jgi:hypothetical protein
MMNRRLAWTIVARFFVFALGYGNVNYEHFTWVNIALTAWYALNGEFGMEHYWFWFFITVNANVIGGVMLMSLDQCQVFVDAYYAVGFVLFVIANYAMHFLGSNLAVAFRTKQGVYCGTVYAIGQVAMGNGLYLIWRAFEDPWNTYGCSLPNALNVMGATVVSVMVGLIAWICNEDIDIYDYIVRYY